MSLNVFLDKIRLLDLEKQVLQQKLVLETLQRLTKGEGGIDAITQSVIQEVIFQGLKDG